MVTTQLVPSGAHEPLMQPIIIGNKEYRTTHFLHRDYRMNSPHGGKYYLHGNFIRVLKGLETYQAYVEAGDLLIFSSYRTAMAILSKTEKINEHKALREAFQSINNHTLYLVNATVQVALCHHLDDEENKRLSVAANTATARQLTGQGRLPAELAKRTLRAYLDIAKMLGCPEHVAQQYAVKRILIEMGTDLQSLLNAAEPQEAMTAADIMLEPNDLAKTLGFGEGNAAGHRLNTCLEQIGWQRRISGKWTMTPEGQPYGMDNPWINNGKTGYNIKWRVEATRNELRRHNMLPTTTAA